MTPPRPPSPPQGVGDTRYHDGIISFLHSKQYPHFVWSCVASVILIVAASHFIALLWHARTRPRSPARPRKRGVIQWRRLPAAVLNAFRAIAFRWTIPIGSAYTLNVAEVLFTAADIVVLFVWSLANSTDSAGHRYDPNYWANVAGGIAASQFPLVVALGTKNNIITLLTGVNPEKLNYLHRMYARVLTILVWLHGGGRIRLGIETDIPFIQCGILAASSLSLLTLISIRPLRKRHYEIFLIVHFTLVLTFLVAAYLHTSYFRSASHYIWPALLIWGIDRVLRLLRILLFNTTLLQSGPPRAVLAGHVSSLSPHLLRITLPRPTIHWSPGQSAYLSVVSWAGCLQAHPFTIASVDSPQGAGGREDEAKGGRKLVFFVKVREGFTKRLMRAVESGEQDMKFIVDGPYGAASVLRGYETVVLIAAGSGVSFTLPLLLDQLSRMKRGTSACTRIVFVWAIPDRTAITWIADDLVPALRDIPTTCTVGVRIHITGVQSDGHRFLATLEKSPPPAVDSEPPSPDDDVEAKTDEKDASVSTVRAEVVGVDVRLGRPDVWGILEEEIGNVGGDVSVNVCGNHGMISAVRHALSPLRFVDVLKGGPSVSLYVETYGNG